MKKFINPLPAGKMPVFKNDLLQIQDETFEAILQVLNGVATTPYVVSGMVATDLGGGNVSITPGYAFIDGDIIKFTGYSGPFPAYVKQGTALTTNKIYFDGSTQTVTSEKTLTTVTTDPGGNRILFNYDTQERLKNKITEQYIPLLALLPLVDAWSTYNITNADLSANTGTWTLSLGTGVIKYKKIGKTVSLDIRITNTNTSVGSLAELKIAIPPILGVPTSSYVSMGHFVNSANSSYNVGPDVGTTVVAMTASPDGLIHLKPYWSSINNFYTIGANNVNIYGQITFDVV